MNKSLNQKLYFFVWFELLRADIALVLIPTRKLETWKTKNAEKPIMKKLYWWKNQTFLLHFYKLNI